ncbi:MAG: adenylate/guanylate cyclase domain-containing protein [Betaproteobacteria bacterium]|nr:adenylate/guanylate cyclase domain-containing protein [Betaproteobacteria bacterium]
MPEGTKRRVRLLLGILGLVMASAIVFGAIAGIAYFPNQPLPAAAFGALAAVFAAVATAPVIVGAEIFLPRTRLGLALERAPLLVILVVKSIAYSGVIVLVVGSRLGRWASAYVIFGPEAAQVALQPGGLPVAVSLSVVFLLIFVAISLVQLASLVGGSTLRDIALGRYHRSRIEERFFLFIDIVGSTPLAERLGPASVHDFLNRVFQIASDPIDDHGGDVYQYVGDEVVITWTLAEGRSDARPIACYFAVKRVLDLAAKDFEQEFGAVPQLRAALHAGPVITGEVGGSRRAIVFHGDVMNTTSRIENATRDLGRPFLVSEDALSRLDGTEAYTMVDLGEQQLRGREARVRVFAPEIRVDA